MNRTHALALRDIAFVCGIVAAVLVLPQAVETYIASRHPYVVDCDMPLEAWKARIETVVSDGRTIVKCKEPLHAAATE